MNKYGFDGSEQFRPLTPWAYVGYSVLFSIPLIGLILLIVFSFSDNNINRRSYARSFFCWLIIGIIISAILAVTGVGNSLSTYLSSLKRIY